MAGLVTEVGGLLSHTALVAREQRLPAIVGVRGAMGFFKSGETIVLDAVHGIVRKQCDSDRQSVSKETPTNFDDGECCSESGELSNRNDSSRKSSAVSLTTARDSLGRVASETAL